MASQFRAVGQKLVIIASVVLFGATAIGVLISGALWLMQTKPIWYPLALEAAEDSAAAEADKND